jgi:hypothetical protein
MTYAWPSRRANKHNLGPALNQDAVVVDPESHADVGARIASNVLFTALIQAAGAIRQRV